MTKFLIAQIKLVFIVFTLILASFTVKAQAESTGQLASRNSEILTEQTADHKELKKMLNLINQARQQRNLQSLQINSNLEKSSQYFASFLGQNDLDGRHFAHTEESGANLGRGPWQRCQFFGYNLTCGENLAAGQTTAEQAFSELMTSASHRQNILNPKYCQIGLAKAVNPNSFYQVYWVQNFGRNCSAN